MGTVKTLLLPSCWNAPVNMIYKKMDFPIGHVKHLVYWVCLNTFSPTESFFPYKTCLSVSFPSKSCFTVSLEFP